MIVDIDAIAWLRYLDILHSFPPSNRAHIFACHIWLTAYHKLTTDAHKDDPNRDAKIDHHKHDSVQKAKKGDAEWKPELASSSEQAVASEKNDMSMEEMQKMGKDKAEQGKSPSGSSSS